MSMSRGVSVNSNMYEEKNDIYDENYDEEDKDKTENTDITNGYFNTFLKIAIANAGSKVVDAPKY